MRTEYPWVLLLLAIVPWLAWRQRSAARRAVARFSSLAPVVQAAGGWRSRWQPLLTVVRLAAVVLLIVALARPQVGRKQTMVDREGIAIELVIDRSGSMQALDFQLNGRPVDRLSAVKHVASRFVVGGEGLPGRFDDLVGLITFAAYADGVCPLTLDHSYLVGHLEQAEIVRRRGEDGTAIGDAVGLAVEKLRAVRRDARRKVKSHVIILLTDGENNAGQLRPKQAAQLAARMGIRIYTIGVGTKGLAPVPMTDVWGRQVIRQVPVSIDEATLKHMARTTGGKYFRATDTGSLAHIYREIDQLEKSEIRDQPMTDYRDLAIDSTRWGRWTLPPLVLVALALLLAEAVLAELILAPLV